MTAQKDSDNDVRRMYLDVVKEEDKRIADAWKEDANGILVFVSPSSVDLLVRLNDKLKDRSFRCNCWCIHH
jgi:uroporphyrinogen-III synthase